MEWAAGKSKRTRLELLHFVGEINFWSPADISKYPAANCICTQKSDQAWRRGRLLLTVNIPSFQPLKVIR